MANRDRRVTETDIDCLKDVFKLFDHNKDGEISAKELDKVMVAHGLYHSPEELVQMIQRVDTNENGSIDFDEFVDLFLGHRDDVSDVEDEIAVAFKVFDHDGNGLISADEMSKTMKNLGEVVTEAEVKAMIAEADINGDGQIDIEEFSLMMQNFGKLRD